MLGKCVTVIVYICIIVVFIKCFQGDILGLLLQLMIFNYAAKGQNSRSSL